MGLPAPRLALGLVAVLVVSGCGSGGGKDNGLGKAELTKQATAICKAHNEKIARAASQVLAGGKLPDPRKFAKLALGTIIPETRAEIAELRRLKPPADLAAKYDKWLADLSTVVDRAKRDPRIITSARNFASVNAEGRSLGLAACKAGPG